MQPYFWFRLGSPQQRRGLTGAMWLGCRALVGLHHWKTRQEPKPGQQTEELRTSPPATAIEAAESPPATLAASMVSSIATSILEAPAELFRHRLQVGGWPV